MLVHPCYYGVLMYSGKFADRSKRSDYRQAFQVFWLLSLAVP